MLRAHQSRCTIANHHCCVHEHHKSYSTLVHIPDQSVSTQCTSHCTTMSCPLWAHCVSVHCSTLYTSCSGRVSVDIGNIPQEVHGMACKERTNEYYYRWLGRLYLTSWAVHTQVHDTCASLDSLYKWPHQWAMWVLPNHTWCVTEWGDSEVHV